MPQPAPGRAGLRKIRLDERGLRLQPVPEQRAVCVQKNGRTGLFAGERPVAVDRLRQSRRDAAGEYDQIAVRQPGGQLFKKRVRRPGRDRRARFVDVGIGMLHRVDELEVGARFVLRKKKQSLHADRLQGVCDALPGGAAEDGGCDARLCERVQDFGNIDALPAGIGAQGGDAVDLAGAEIRDLNSLVQRGIEGNGIDHCAASVRRDLQIFCLNIAQKKPHKQVTSLLMRLPLSKKLRLF